MPKDEDVGEIRDALVPNQPFIHPRTELISSDRWVPIATLNPNCVFFIVHITHTTDQDGDGVLLGFEHNLEDRDILGPFFGDTAPVKAGLPPTSRIFRRARPKHIYAKLDEHYYVPDQTTTPREDGPILNVEEWFTIVREGETDQSESEMGAKRGQTSYLMEVQKEQREMEEEIREGE